MLTEKRGERKLGVENVNVRKKTADKNKILGLKKEINWSERRKERKRRRENM